MQLGEVTGDGGRGVLGPEGVDGKENSTAGPPAFGTLA